jgi:excisionase family DNA binding protein
MTTTSAPRSQPPVPRRALRPREAQQALGLGKTTIYALMRDGRLPSVRVGAARLIPIEAIEALIAAGKGDPSPSDSGPAQR